MALHMLTTVDNPFSPVTQWDEWLQWDEACGYYTCSYLARVARSSPDLSDADEALAIEQAIEEIIEMNPNGLYRAVELPLESVA